MSKLLNRSLKAARLPYDPKKSMNSWLHQFNLHFQRLSLTIEQKLLHINQYMPSDVANWTSLGTALLQTFGIPAAKHKQVVRSRLELLR